MTTGTARPAAAAAAAGPVLLAGCALAIAVPAAAQTAPPPGTAISDDELARSLPPLPDTPAPPPPAPPRETGAPGAAAAETSPPPAADPQLALPLPPLDRFDPETIVYPGPDPAAQAAQLRYVVKVEGLDAADRAAATGLAGRFHGLSALREGGGKAANEAMLTARLDEDRQLLERLLRSEGWYEAAVSTRIDRSAAADGQPVTALLTVAPGQRYTLATITVTAPPTIPPHLIADALALKVGEPIVADRILGAEAAAALVLPQNGYPFAELGARDIVLDPATHGGDYTLPVAPGPRARFGAITTTGKLAFGARHAAVLARFRRGDLYDSRLVDDYRQALIATGLFSAIAIEPVRTGEDAGGGSEYVTVQVTQQAGPPRTIAASAGYGTGQGFRIEGSWTHRNLLRPEGALIAAAVLGTDEQSAGVTLRRSNAGRRDRTFQLSATALRARYDAFDALTGRLAARLSYDSTPLWQKRLTWAAGAELLGTIEEDYNPARAARAKRKFLIGALSGQVGIDRTDSLLDPTRGFRAQVLVQPEAALHGSVRPYLRSQADASAYHAFGRGLVLAARGRLGSIVGIDRFALAPSRRYYAGGGGSVRGFGYQQLGPKDPNGDPLGGLSLVEGSLEGRYRFGDFGLAAFVDAGQVGLGRLPDFRHLRVGVGVGGRYYTNLGPIRIDVATPLARRKGEGRINVYVSIGQAF